MVLWPEGDWWWGGSGVLEWGVLGVGGDAGG